MAAGDTRSQLRLFRNQGFAALAVMNFVRGMAFATIIVALALYADLFETSGFVAGLFGTAYAFVRLVLVVPVGRWIDVRDAKRLLVIGLVLQVVVLAGYVFVESALQLVGIRAFQGVSSITVYLAGTAIVGSLGPEGDRGLWVGTYQNVTAFSKLSGDLLGAGLLFFVGFESTWAIFVVLSTLSVGYVLKHLPAEPVPSDDSSSTAGKLLGLLKRRAIMALVAFRFSFSFCKEAVLIFLPVFARLEFGMNALLIGGILAGGRFTKSISQGYIGQLGDRVGRLHWFILMGIVLYAIGTAMIPLAVHADEFIDPVALTVAGREETIPGAFFVLFFCYVLLGIADSLRIPTSVTMFVREGEYQDAVGSSISLRSLSWQIGATIGPVAVGVMTDVLSYTAAFWAAATLALCAGVLFATLYRDEPPPE
ncbi:MFS transporter [Saliphagus sp. LR7]|uniref:MFS transporter n=1 Tax=Saliphagus sp. LR7 TaxID=2282654 RepID=UPI000DF80D5D|nr:MFS transporter [Saliphagus sp. LR7]